MDNAPHVHVLRPIILDLEERGHQVDITARDYGQTLPLLRMYGLTATRVGRHAGKNLVMKYVAFVLRSAGLFFFGLGKGFDAAFCHGSRSVIPAARLLGVPVVCLSDYEHSRFPSFMKSWVRLFLVPDVIPVEAISDRSLPVSRIHRYPGLKEDLYIHDFEPDSSFAGEMGIDTRCVLVLVRPPASMAHYAVKESEDVFQLALEYFAGQKGTQIILLPRTERQKAELRALVRNREYVNIFIPDAVYNGPNLVWHADLVISGGGTMNREAAALGVPVFSIYQGPMGAVDRHLVRAGRLVHAKGLEELRNIPLVKSTPRYGVPRSAVARAARDSIVSEILRVAGGR
jgi:uncharacterized protein